MAIVAGFDVHRAQITFDALDTDTGEVLRGRIDATPAAVGRWAARFAGRRIEVAVEACTGWLFVCDALAAAGAVPHLAEPVETRALRGRKRRAKTDREDARWLRELLCDGRLPEAWIPPEHVRQWRSRARLRHTLLGERTQWFQRIRATLFQHGVDGTPERLRTADGRAFLQRLELPPDARERIEIALAMIDAIDTQIAPLERELRQLARHQTGCRALMGLYGMGELTSLVIDYTPAPEARHPVQVHQGETVLAWIAEHGPTLGLDAGRIAVAGDSSGANLATVWAMLAKHRPGIDLAAQVLFFPTVDASFDTDSYRQFAAGPYLDEPTMRWFWHHYLPDVSRRGDPTASPLRASLDALHGLPPALVITAESDVLRDEGESYARRLADAGVDVTAVRYLATIHAFVVLDALARTPAARAAITQAGSFLRDRLGT